MSIFDEEAVRDGGAPHRLCLHPTTPDLLPLGCPRPLLVITFEEAVSRSQLNLPRWRCVVTRARSNQGEVESRRRPGCCRNVVTVQSGRLY